MKMKRFQTSKYRNAAPKIPKKEVNIAVLYDFPAQTSVLYSESA